MGCDKKYRNFRRDISKKMRKILLSGRKKLDIGIKEYSDYYYIAFPIAMRLYGGINMFLNKFKKGGLICAVKEIIAHISNR